MIETLKHIAGSPSPEHGGFDARTVSAVKWALSEIERLQSIVDRLQKTADGVPVFEYDNVWYIEDGGLICEACVCTKWFW